MMKCMIVDDEPLARDVLIQYIEQVDTLELCASCKDGIEAMNILEKTPVDLIFLDINMPKLSGISFYRSLEQKPLVIFTTAYPDYAVEGFELEALDYLVKPISLERFLKATQRALHKHTADQETHHIMLKADKKNHRLKFDDIQFFESIGDYVKVHLHDGSALIISETLKKLEQMLPETAFLRVHKSYILSINKIAYQEGNRLKIGEQLLTIGQSYRDRVAQVLRR